MSTMLFKFLFLKTFLIFINCEVHKTRPSIKTEDGDLIIEPAFGKNIYFRPNGPKSSVYIGGVNLLTVNLSSSDIAQGQSYPNTNIDFERALNGPNGVIQRLEWLESRQLQPADLQRNLTALWRRVNRLINRVNTIQAAVNIRERDECSTRPCLNGGTCLNLFNGYHCLCSSNWEGKNCDVDVNECRNFIGTDLGCQNGATCKNLPGSYECQCRSGWYGIHCTRRAKDCNGGNFEMCGHGTCLSVDTGEGIKCICDQGWTTNGTGVACLTDVNECESYRGAHCSVNPTVECINTPGSFKCGECPAGYEGDGYICRDIDECLTIPNGGCSTSPYVTCHNTIGSRICGACPIGYQGDGVNCFWRGSCAINRGGCHPSAQCIDNPAGGQIAQCICPPGLEGDGVGINGCYVPTGNDTRGCDSNPCGIHGQCHPLRTGYTCICHRGYGGARCDVTSDYCRSNPCMNGGRCRPDESTARGFQCECTSQYSGDLCHVAAKTCGGLLTHQEGSISYPLTNKTYNHNSGCVWVIQTSRDKVINVTFSKFDLEETHDCAYDFLQIHDGRSSASQLIGRFCGKNFPKGGNIISSHNTLYFWFNSDHSVAENGFTLHWTTINPQCGGELDATIHGHISSPGSPGKYPPNRDCYWHLATTLGKRIQLQFFALDIESHPNCNFDFLAIYDGQSETDPLLSKFCNSTHPAPLQSAGSDILIHFHSDAYKSGFGFQLTFAPTDGVPGCGGLYTTDFGELSSPSHNGKYLANMLCEYKIKTSPDTNIELQFNLFKLESSFRCVYDYVKIYDGPTEESRLVGKFCGSTFPKSFSSSSNQILIIFRSDQSMTQEGFRISYAAKCKYTILGDTGVIKSPGYPSNYPADRVCEYLLGTSPGKAIQLTFHDFDIEDSTHYSCRYDNLEIRDGTNTNATSLGKFCGGISRIPASITSTHNYMYLKFTSDISVSGTGFYANFTSIDIQCGGIYRERTGIISHPSVDKEEYSDDQTCKWILIAPHGMYIKITWNRFDLESTPLCTSDYVTLDEVDENNELNHLGTYCGEVFPPSITTSQNQLQIKFISDFILTSHGFSLSYTFLEDTKHCIRTFSKPHGFIYSPGWPEKYDNYRDCTWTIKAPAGQQIRLDITQFHLEEPIRESCENGDYLEIRNGEQQTSPLLGKFCGRFQSKRIISMANTLYLHFHSDSYFTGGGFKIEWDSALTGCGGTMTSSSGIITSPNYPNHYSENAECFYKIVTNAGTQIQIAFTDLDLEQTTDCKDDFVQIFDGRDGNSPSMGKYCRMIPELRLIKSSSNHVAIKFRSDWLYGGKGFSLNYNSVCQTNLTGFHGIIESPGYPGQYESGLNCLWTINVPKGNKINITFTGFSITDNNWLASPRFRFDSFTYRPLPSLNSHCGSDFMQIKETSDVNYGEKLCGGISPGRFSSKTNSLQIKFVSGRYSPSSQGFRLEWARFGCGGYIKKYIGTLKIDRMLASSGELDCEWLIETKVGRSVTLDVTEKYMSESPNCTVDAIEVYNGNTRSAPLLTKICHKDAKASVTATSNIMLVRFVKRSTLRDVYFKSRFHSWLDGCGGLVYSLFGVIHSKNYPRNYDNDLNCMWTINVPDFYRIELNFIDFDLYSVSAADTEECADSVKIYDGLYAPNQNYTLRLCPNSEKTQFISKYNMMGITFSSDDYGTAKGFKANFTVTCGATIPVRYDGIISIDSWHATHVSKNCTWTLLAPTPDKKISLTITYMSIPKNTDIITNRKCPSSFLRIYDGDDDKAPVVEEYCGKKIPPTIVSHGSALTIVLGSYNGTVQGKFTAHYSPLSSACGGYLSSEEGTIASPNYPQSYPVSTSCEWTLNTSPGNRAYIMFEQFDLEYSENCNEDYLEVRETDGSGRLIGVYCGSDLPTNTTVGSKLYLKFHSGSKSSRKGFVIHYGFLHGNDITDLVQGEITSPLYPQSHEGAGDFSWRITVDGSKIININLDRVEIPSSAEQCDSSLIIYDGYDDQAPILDESCGMLLNRKELKTTSNVVYLKFTTNEDNTGALFHLRWTSTDSDIDSSSSDQVNCGSNETGVVRPGQSVIVTSPNYPNSYNDNLECEWVFKATDGNRVNLHFDEMQLEQTPSCFADYVSIYSSENPAAWKPVKENICLSEQTEQNYNATSFMKVIFHSDSSISRPGFKAKVTSVCGGLSKGLSGTVGPTWLETVGKRTVNCDYTIKVRPGRVIVLSFDVFNITKSETDCVTYVILRNGDSSEAPLLGDGRYCGYDHENKTYIESSSNVVYVSYRALFRDIHEFQTFRLRYEEKGIECGVTSTLDNDHPWEVLNSPRYPSTPSPYTECTWVYSGPPGEILRIDFIDRFDLDHRKDCSLEYVEFRDGGTDLAPLLGRLCEEKPNTIKTSSNIVYIKYHTQIEEPRNGFKANVSIDYCGGTIRALSGEVTSPGFPSLPHLQYGSVCEWKIIGSSRRVFKIKPRTIDFPKTESHCGTKITIEETVPVNNSVTILKTYCIGNEDEDIDMGLVETSSNQVSIKLYVNRPVPWLPDSSFKGFRFTFNSSQPICGGDVSTSEGYIQTPGYPRDTSVKLCQWKIRVPNQMRRIRLEILDSDVESHMIGIFDDLNYQAIQQILPRDNAPNLHVFESTGPTMALYLNSYNSIARHRFRAKFESNLPALCGGPLTGEKGMLSSPYFDQSYSCEWHYSANDLTNSSQFKTLLINAKMNYSSTIRNKLECSIYDPRIIIKPHKMSFNTSVYKELLCGNTEASIRIPSTAVDINAIREKGYYFSFNLEWKLQPCGGVIHIDETEVNILEIPLNVNDTIDCAWSVIVPFESKLQIKLDGSFELDCNNEFLQIGQTVDEDTHIAEFCKDKSQDTPLITSFRFLLIQYHSNKLNKRSLRVMAKTVTNHCGGILMDYQRMFESPNYPKNYPSNIECAWEIKSNVGFTISLNFVNRFAIEERTNCTKDAVIIYDYRFDEYVEIAKVCGRVIPPVFNSTNNRMKVVLRSDAGLTLDGFRAIWTPICGGKLNATNEVQMLYSPSYPKAYSPMQECNYEISGNGKKVSIKFLDFELEGNYPVCQYDNLTIKANSDYHYLLDTYCGTEMPAETHEFEKINLIFKSDAFVQRKGFKLSYQIYNCNSRITEPTLITTGDSETYGSNENCTWSIVSPTDKNVIIKFQEIKTETYNDYIAVYDGLNVDITKRLAHWSGNVNNPGILKSNNNTMLVQFVSDGSLNYKGFKAFVYFSYSAAVGCGGRIDLSVSSKHTLKSPLIGGSAVYEKFLDCHWTIEAPVDYIVEIEFKSFHIAPCQGVNQTALGISKCDCDFVEIKDGFNPNDFVIGKYCGHAELPPKLVSSANLMSVRLSTDGEIQSSGFEAFLSVKPSICGRTLYKVSNTVQIVKSPGFDAGFISRNLHCVYDFESSNEYDTVHLTVKYLDVRSGDPDPNQCNKDKLVISSLPTNRNVSLGKDFVVSGNSDYFVSSSYLSYEEALMIPERYTFCGIKKDLDLYVSGNVTVNLQTAPDDDTLTHKGMEIHVVLNQACGRNYTEPSGRIRTVNALLTTAVGDCYTLITAPDNYTISLYFIHKIIDYWNDVEYLDIYDGDKSTANKLLRIQSEFEEEISVFSTGRYLLLHNHYNGDSMITFDANYLQTNKGRGCGGKLHNLLGKVTSPLYPSVYREKNTCEWELETTPETRLRLHFTVFDLGRICDQNYLQLVDRNGKVISTYCEQMPADYISNDNYVKIVFVTTKNNSGTGWVADFIGVI